MEEEGSVSVLFSVSVFVNGLIDLYFQNLLEFALGLGS